MSFFSSAMASIVQDGVAVVKSAIRAWGLTVETKIDEGAWTVVTKQTDEARNTTTTLADDAELAVPMEANTRYMIRGRIFFDCNATADIKWSLAGPSGLSLARVERRTIAAGATTYGNVAVATAFGSVSVTGTGTEGGYIAFEAVIATGANAGDLTFQWAQDTSNAGDSTVLRGSYLEYRKVTP